MSWEEFNAETLFPGPTKDVLEATGEAAKIVADTADVLADGLDTVADLLTVIAASKLPIIQALKNLIEDTFNTGLYFFYETPTWPMYPKSSFSWEDMRREMNIDGVEDERRREAEAAGEDYVPPVLPLEPSRTHGFTGWKALWRKSFYDAGDKKRPVFSEDAELTCVLFVAGTPSIDAFPALLSAIGRLLGIKAFTDLLDRLFITQLAEDAQAGDRVITVKSLTEELKGFSVDRQILIGPFAFPFVQTFEFATIKGIEDESKEITLYHPLKNSYAAGRVVAMTAMGPPTKGDSKAPDWEAIRVRDIPPINKLERQVKRLLGLLDIGEGILALLIELAEALAEKADELRALADEITELIELIESILALTGVYIIKLDSSTGIQGLFDALDEEGGPPLPAASFVVGACLLAGTADFAGFGDMLGV